MPAGGRLPVTWYPNELTHTVAMTDMAMRPDPSRNYPGRTYRFYTGTTVYEFGHGLGYSSSNTKATFSSTTPARVTMPSAKVFAASVDSTAKLLQCSQLSEEEIGALTFEVNVTVTNKGTNDGSHTTMLFVRSPSGTDSSPLKQLVGFERVHVGAGQTVQQVFEVQACKHFSQVSSTGERLLSSGWHDLLVEEEKYTVSLEVE